MDIDQEEIVKLIFGEQEPEGWRENPEFLLYLNELGNMGGERLLFEPDNVSEQLSSIQSQTQELAFSNYKTFIHTSNCTQEIFSEFGSAEKHLDGLVDQLPGFIKKCEEFQGRANEITTHRRLTSLTLSKHNNLLEILELPQLMDTVVRNQHYEEALELNSYVSKLSRKHPNIPILEDVTKNVNNSMKLMLQQLLAQLRAPIQLPQCLKVISYLRRMDVFTETELRLKFLQARETWLQSVTNAIPRDDPYLHLTRTMEMLRVHLFDVVTQYRAIFSDDVTDILNKDQASNVQLDNRLLFSSWLSKKIHEFLAVLERDLESDIGSLESVAGQAMYFGLSFSRVGADFRSLLVPIFENAVKKQFKQRTNFEANLSRLVTDSLNSLNLQKLAGIEPAPWTHIQTTGKGDESIIQPPQILLDFPPLAHVCNAVLTGLNEIRMFAPLSLCVTVTDCVGECLTGCAQLLANMHALHSPSWGDKQKTGFQNLVLAFTTVLVPYLQRCVLAVFPANQVSAVTGLGAADLQSLGLGYIDQKSTSDCLQAFLPEKPEMPMTSGDPSAATDYVADKMADLALAIEETSAPVDEAVPAKGVQVSNDGGTEQTNPADDNQPAVADTALAEVHQPSSDADETVEIAVTHGSNDTQSQPTATDELENVEQSEKIDSSK